MTNDELFRRDLMDGRIRDQNGVPVLRLIVTEAEPRDYSEDDDEPLPFEARPSMLPGPLVLAGWAFAFAMIACIIGISLAQLSRL